MCACEPGFVCSTCTGDPKQDHRVEDEPDRWQEEQEEAVRLARRLADLRWQA